MPHCERHYSYRFAPSSGKRNGQFFEALKIDSGRLGKTAISATLTAENRPAESHCSSGTFALAWVFQSFLADLGAKAASSCELRGPAAAMPPKPTQLSHGCDRALCF